MKRLVIVLLSCLTLTCRRESELIIPDSQTIYFETNNIMPLKPGEGHYEAWISFANPYTSKSRTIQDEESSFVSLGKFTMDTSGFQFDSTWSITGTNQKLLDLDGNPFVPRLQKNRNLQYAVDAIITIELEGDTDDVPGSVIIGGAFTGTEQIGTANLSTNYRDAFDIDFGNAEGFYLLDAPTSSDPSDSLKGIWFMKSIVPESAGLMNIPQLPEGWKYEGWVRYFEAADAAGYLPTGKFLNPDSADEDAAGAEKGPNGDGYNFPGQDFVIRYVSFTILSAMITIEPEPDNSEKPFRMLTLFGPTDIPQSILRGKAIQMSNNAASFPTAKLTIYR